MTVAHDFTCRTIDGKERSLDAYKGRVLLVVNVASRCGLTPQYEGLQQLYDGYRERGLEVLGFPCNQFAGQEPGSEADIQSFCSTQYGVTFPLFAKVDVNGGARAPLYEWLTQQDVGPEGAGDIKWNFGKFLVGRDGRVVARFDPRTAPTSLELVEAVEQALGS
jgi:glutathione peroxidase